MGRAGHRAQDLAHCQDVPQGRYSWGGYGGRRQLLHASLRTAALPVTPLQMQDPALAWASASTRSVFLDMDFLLWTENWL